jgi:hypothetical protein
MHTRVGKNRSLAAAHWTTSNLQQQLTAATACKSNLQPATANDRSNLQPVAAYSNLQPTTASNLQQQLTAAAAYSNSSLQQ